MRQEQLINLPIEWKRGNGLRKSDLEDGGRFKCILYGELYTKHKSALIENRYLSNTNNKGTFYSKKGDILVPGTSTASKKDMLLAREIDEDGVILGGDINVIRPQQGLFAKKYLPYFFDTFSAYDQLDKYITGATGIIHISNTGLKRLKIPLPTYQEQQRIVAILDEAFAAIAKAKANAEQNLKNAKELFESYLQGVFEKKGEGWEEKTLGEIGKPSMCKRILKHQTSSIGDIPFYKIGTFGKKPDAFISKEIYDEFRTKYSFPKKGDILISASGTIGRRVRYDGEPAFFQDSNIVWIDNNEKQVLNDYLYVLYEFCDWQPSKGATISRLYNNNLISIKINFPKSLEEQQTIVRQLDALRAETQKLEAVYQKKLADLEELKKSILQKAFAGELTYKSIAS